MHRVDTSTAAVERPDPEAEGTPGYFTQGNILAGIPATVPGQDWFNAVQEEIINVIIQAGLEPSKNERDQLARSVTFFPSGTKLVFYQAAPPPGWTQDAAHNDKALRVVSGAGGGNGGTHGLSTPPSINHSHTGPSHTHTGPSHAHDYSDVPQHFHTIDTIRDAVGGPDTAIQDSTIGTLTAGNHATNVAGVAAPVTSAAGAGDTGASGTGNTGADGAGNTSAAGAGDTGASGSGNTSDTNPTAFAPKYIDVIVCTKD